MIVFTNRRREGFGAERIATEDGLTVADRRLIFKKFKAGKFSMGAFQFLVQVQPDEPPHPSPRPSPLWYVFSAPTALKAWSPGFGRNSSGGNRGNRDFPKVGCGLEVAWVLHLSVSMRDLPKTLFGLMFMTLFPLLSHVQQNGYGFSQLRVRPKPVSNKLRMCCRLALQRASAIPRATRFPAKHTGSGARRMIPSRPRRLSRSLSPQRGEGRGEG